MALPTVGTVVLLQEQLISTSGVRFGIEHPDEQRRLPTAAEARIPTRRPTIAIATPNKPRFEDHGEAEEMHNTSMPSPSSSNQNQCTSAASGIKNPRGINGPGQAISKSAFPIRQCKRHPTSMQQLEKRFPNPPSRDSKDRYLYPYLTCVKQPSMHACHFHTRESNSNFIPVHRKQQHLVSTEIYFGG